MPDINAMRLIPLAANALTHVLRCCGVQIYGLTFCMEHLRFGTPVGTIDLSLVMECLEDDGGMEALAEGILAEKLRLGRN